MFLEYAHGWNDTEAGPDLPSSLLAVVSVIWVISQADKAELSVSCKFVTSHFIAI